MIGLDDLPVRRVVTPPLTTVRQPVRENEEVWTDDGRVFQTFEVRWFPVGSKDTEDKLPFVSVQVIPTLADVKSPFDRPTS